MTTTNSCCEKCGIQVEDTQIMIPCEHCSCHQAGTSESKCPHPICSHNTNGRDADKPCSIAWPGSEHTAIDDWEMSFDYIYDHSPAFNDIEAKRQIKEFTSRLLTQAKADGRREMKEEIYNEIERDALSYIATNRTNTIDYHKGWNKALHIVYKVINSKS